MATEGIAAALSIDTKIQTDLEKAQSTIDNMADAAERLSKSFDSMAANAANIASALNSTQVSIKFEDGNLKNEVDSIVDAAEKLSKTKSALDDIKATAHEAGRAIDDTAKGDGSSWFEQDVRNKIDILKQMYEEILADEQELRKAAVYYVPNSEEYNAAIAQIQSYRESLKGIKTEIENLQPSTTTGLGPSAFNEEDFNRYYEWQGQMEEDEKRRLQAIEEESARKKEKWAQEDAATKASIAAYVDAQDKKRKADAEYIDWWTRALDKLDSPEKKRVAAASNKLLAAYGMEEDPETIAKKIKKIESAVASLKALQAQGNTFVNQDEIDKAIEKLDELDKKQKQIFVDKASNNLSNALGLGDNGIAEITEKKAQVENMLNELIAVAGNDADPKLIKQANEKIAELNTKLEISRTAMGRVTKAASEMSSIMKTAFSSLAMGALLKNIVQIRGEFEMAEKSIGIIINDGARAKSIFNEIQNIAIKSPFQIKDLVKQTKQLAAYRIETDKLVETTKMLGDISAGVGIDMQRLILAFGQVKAATYLKGTELRQFSEAGVNMLGGLADRFSEVENRAVSTGEVLQMISKRMVSFEDVNAVLQKQTQAGGTFYKMQEKQAETLQGRISNLRDKLDVMFNDIGKSSQGLMIIILDAFDAIIQNYNLLEPILVGGLGFKVASLLITSWGKFIPLLKNIGALLSFIRTEGLACIKTLEMVNPMIAAATAVAAAITTIVLSMTKLRRELNKLAKESKKDTAEMIANFDRLVMTVSNGNKSIEERDKALEEMKVQFGNIIPLENEHIGTIEKGSQKYKEYADAIRQSNYELLKEKQILEIESKIYENQEKAASKARATIATSLVEILKVRGSIGDMGELLSDAGNVSDAAFIEIQDRIISGRIKTSKEAAEEYAKIWDDFYGYNQGYVLSLIKQEGQLKSLENQFEKIIKKMSLVDKINEKRLSISNYGFAGQELGEAISNLGQYKQEWANFYRFMRDESGNIMKDKNGKSIFNPEFNGNEAALELAAQNAVNDYAEALRQAIANSSDVTWGAIGNEFTFKIGDSLKKSLNDTQKGNLTSSLDKALREILSSPLETLLTETFAKVNQKFPILMNKFGQGNFMVKPGEGIQSFTDRMYDLLEATEKGIGVWGNFDITMATSVKQIERITEAAGGSKEVLLAEQAALQDVLAELAKYGYSKNTKVTKEHKRDIRAFVEEVVSASERLDELNDAGDTILMNKLEFLSKKLNISLPKEYTQQAIEDWLDGVERKFKDELTKDEMYDIKLGINTTLAEKELEALKKEEEKLWEKYNIAKKFSEYGINVDGYDANETFSAILEVQMKYLDMGTKAGREAAEELRRKRIEIFEGEQAEAAKIMYESQKKAMSETEKLYAEMFDDIAKMRGAQSVNMGDFGFSKESVDDAIAARVTKGLKDINKAQWEAYKSTSMYTAAFGDLDALSHEVLVRLKNDLEGFVNNSALQPTDLRAVNKVIRSINDELATGNRRKEWFGSIVDGFKAIQSAGDKFNNTIPLLEKKFVMSSNMAKEAYDDMKEAEDLMNQNPGNDFYAGQYELLRRLYEMAKKDEEEAFARLDEERKMALADLQNADKKAKDITDAYGRIGKSISDIINLVDQIGDAFDLNLSDDTSAALEGFEQGFALVGTAISVATSATIGLTMAMMTFNVTAGAILWPVLAIGAALGTIVAVIKGSDASIKSRIENHKKKVEELEKAYSDLQDRFEKAMSMAEAATTYSKMMSNLKEQYIELNEALTANSQRKQTNAVKEETESIKEQMDEVMQKIEEANEQKMELLGAPSNYQDVAKDWASSWLDSFKETGDGISALEDNFNDLYDSIIAGQIQSLVMGPAIKNLENMINSALNDFYLSDEEARAIKAYRDNELAVINQRAKDLAEYLGVGSTSSFEGDTLQRGIEGVTEQTAQALESILNSTRYYVADNNRILLALESAFTGEEGENTILSNIRAQTKYLRSLATIADAVYYSGSHPKGAGGIKVFID